MIREPSKETFTILQLGNPTKKLFLVLIILWSGVQVPDGPPHTFQMKTTAYGKPWAVFFWRHQGTMDFGESFGVFLSGGKWVMAEKLGSWETGILA